MSNLFGTTALIGGGAVISAVALFVLMVLRRVVPTNEVHIVQSSKKTTSYGKDTPHGNTYYQWPSWVPVIGVSRTRLPVSVFDLDLEAYEAYDKGRLPFVVDVKAFFCITDSNMAAQRVSSFTELHNQLKAIVQGAVRVILASNDIEEILQGRSTFGEQFTREVKEQLQNWGVSTVKNIELMDIRDSTTSQVIHNIMEKKKSHIEMESRTEVAKNKRIAEIAEIEAKREVELQLQAAAQVTGMRTIEAQRAVELQGQEKIQVVKEQEAVTAEKQMAIVRIEQLRKAEIDRQVQVVKAEQDKQTAVLAAEGRLEAKRREAEGIALEGQARAEAEKAMQLAPVQAQIALAQEIGENAGYQQYLTTIRQVEAAQVVGVEQAKALEKADVKVIANAGAPAEGIKSVMELFSSRGGTNLGAMLEALSHTDEGAKFMDAARKLAGKPNGPAAKV